ncbi:amino acid ABC transporter permease [Leuconostoc fallax]|uniref:ABC transmembrane type-1 domain-containing protein n=1 Tax=Leuconostoc fallax TaxID=1251 RepID=A0A4R5N9D9_9LACO|nr:amino acid ABC transporter permease [Leuconostoc fallax]MBU7455905.1 amino acid ABC transporter permease [Leuconostoc fallax]MCO6184411.1 amino acid ABC transporter permease [Leuconostoc fallax]TDG68749.1 hypothetical protein C5L23_000668 [Leuconostoc fallax]
MTTIFTDNLSTFLSGFGYTLLASLIALVGSMILGTLFAILEILPNKALSIFGHTYVEIFRNIPLLVITMFFYIVISNAIKISGFWSGTLGLTLYTSAFIAETVRAGIQSIDSGQMEGARANGLSYGQAMSRIILPQAFVVALPSLANQFINLVKNSSILAFVAGFDIMYQANVIAGLNFDPFNTYIVAGILYLIITLPLSYYMQHLEKKSA